MFTMDQKYKQRLMAEFPGEMRYKELFVLNIPDDYKYINAELVDEILRAIEPILAENAE